MASGCPSSVSLQQSAASNSTRRKSCDTVCSSNSSCFLKKKKPINPLAATSKSYVMRSDHNSSVRQRVFSAKMVKMRNLQSQLNDANYHLMELAKENRALKTLQKRQDKALNNYEGINADLPRLIKSYEEENRTLTEKSRSLRKSLKDLTEQLKMKDDELMSVKDQLKHIISLSKDKHLGEREKLQELLDESKAQIKKYENEIGLLNRKLMLEVKNSKQRLNNEITKHKRCQRELSQAFAEISKLSEGKDNKQQIQSKRRFGGSPHQKQSLSMVCLTRDSGDTPETPEFKEYSPDIKLEPIKRLGSSEGKRNDMLQSPADKIKARLSASQEKHLSINELTEIMDKLSAEEQIIKKTYFSSNRSTKIHSAKLETLPNKSISNGFIDYSSDDNLSNKNDVDSPITSERLKPGFLSPMRPESNDGSDEQIIEDVSTKLNDNELELVSEIWSEEFNFRKSQKDTNGNVTTKNNPIVALENKKKLLATLRDIDNGKSIDEVVDANNEKKKAQFMKELFG